MPCTYLAQHDLESVFISSSIIIIINIVPESCWSLLWPTLSVAVAFWRKEKT